MDRPSARSDATIHAATPGRTTIPTTPEGKPAASWAAWKDRTASCPYCGAAPGYPCVGHLGDARVIGHTARVTPAKGLHH